MKKIINGKRYDTGTAKLIGETQYSNRGDFNFWEEELYQKRTGEFFLYCGGGGNSKHGHWEGNTGGWGEKIKPLTIEEAQEWAEEYLDGETYEEIFKVAEEGKTQIATWIVNSTKSRADELREKGYTLADIFEAGVKALDKE